MVFDRTKIEALLPDGKGAKILDVIEPYLPVLGRLGSTAFDAFVAAVHNRDWQRIDRELYAEMTEDERDALGQAVLAEARQAVQQEYEVSRRWREDLNKVLFAALTSLL